MLTDNDELYAKMKVAVNALSEYCDTVQIICTGVDCEGDTVTFEKGCGNIYARIESCDEFVRELRDPRLNGRLG